MAYQGGVAPNLSRQGSHHSLHGPQGHDTFASHHRLQPANLNQSARNDPRSQSQILGHMTGQTHSQNPHKYVSQPNLSHHESDRRHYGSQQISPKPAYQPIRPQEQSSKPEYLAYKIRADNEPQYSSQQNLSPTNQKPQYQPIRPRNSEGSNLSRPVSLQNLSLEQQWKLVRSESTKSVSGLRPKVQNYAQNQPSPSSPQGQRAVYPEEASPQSTSPKYPPNQSFSRHESEAPPPYQREPEQIIASHQNPQYASQQNGFSTHDSRRSLRSQTSPYPSRKDAKSPPHTTPQMSRKGSEYSHAQRSVRTQQSAHSLMSLASSGSGAHPIPEARGTEASHIIEILKKEIVYLTGGRDRQGGPVLTFPPQPDNPDFNSHDITICLKYLLQIPSEESKRRGFTAIVDSRDGSWQNLVTVLGCLKQSLGDYMKQVLVLKADQQMDRRSSSSSFRRDRNNPNLEPQFVNLQRLHTYVDKNQLTHSYGGILWYHHPEWLQNRIDLEKFIRESRAASSHLDDSETQIHQVYSQRETLTSPLESLRQHRFFQESIMSVPNQVIRDGHDLLTRLKLPGNSEEDTASTLDNLEEQKQVKRLITYLENRVDKLQNLLEDRDRSLSLNLQYEEFQRNVKHVVSWILGPGEKLLASQVGIGDSYLAAEELRKRHEEMEIKCTDTYGQYAELRHTAEELINEEHTATVDIKSTRDYMDTVCRSFASRLDRRRTLLITSVRFHRLAEEFSVKLDDLLEMLCSEIEAEDVPSAEAAIQNLNDKCENLDTLAYQTLNDGQSLLDEMSRPVKNAMGKDITPDYSSQIKHIQKRLEDLQERKLRCDELSDVRKLKLQQILQLRTCERDADQAINWILELCDVMAATHTKMGSTQEEAENLQMEHKKFETTAAGTYEYGKQLLQAGLVLRRSLRYNLTPNNERSHRLEEAWKRFSQGTNERANRLTVSAMFLASADKILDRVDDLLIPISWTMSGEATVPEVLRQYTPVKGQVERDHQETDHMGRALLERLAMPIILTEGREKTVSLDDHEAVEVISSKLSKMEQKLLDLNRYWSEMEKTKMPPASVQYGESRKRQPTRTKTFSGYDTNRNKSQPSQKRQRRSTSDLGGPSAAPERAVRTREKPKPPERSGSLHHNVRPPVREGLVTRASSRPVNAGMTQSLPRNYRPSSPESLKQQLEEVRNSIAIGTLEIHDQEPSLLP